MTQTVWTGDLTNGGGGHDVGQKSYFICYLLFYLSGFIDPMVIKLHKDFVHFFVISLN